jgi:hypothetical protein
MNFGAASGLGFGRHFFSLQAQMNLPRPTYQNSI